MNTITKAIPAVCAAIFCTTSFARTPEVKLVSATQNHRTSAVVCVYSNDIPAIVTFDVLTNGVSIGGRNLRYCVGDVNKYVAAGGMTIDFAARERGITNEAFLNDMRSAGYTPPAARA